MESNSPSPTSALAAAFWIFLRAVLIVLAGCWVYVPSLHGTWLWDDILYLPQHPLLHDPARLWKTWFAPGTFIEYYPVEETLQFGQWRLWHENTFGYHVTNLALHLVNALLLWRLLARLGLRLAWVGGLIFAVHPVLVESVAWIAEFKNTLSLAPFLVALIFWVDYEERRRSYDYLGALGFFLLAMLCKIGMAPFPFVILLYAWWKRGRIGWRDMGAALPFLLISVILAGLTTLSGIWYRQLHPEPAEIVDVGGKLSHLALSGLTLSFYFWKSVWPSDLMFIYPRWKIDPPQPWQFLPLLALVGLAWWFWKFRSGWGRHALLGVGFFVLMLMPFLGLNTISYMRFTWVMDHFLYLPIIGLIALAVALFEELEKRLHWPLRLFAPFWMAAIIVALATEGRISAGVFTDEISLWTQTLEHNPSAWMAHNNLGNALQAQGRFKEALVHYDEAIRLNPSYPDPHTNRAAILVQISRLPEALIEYNKVLQLDPNVADAHYNLGNAYFQSGKIADAIEQFGEAVKIDPALAEAHYNLGNALLQTGRIPEAITQYQITLALNADDADAHANLGNALLQVDRVDDALQQYAEALRITPYDLDVRKNVALVLTQLGRLPEARAAWEELLRLNPADPDAKGNIAKINAQEKSAHAQH